MPFLSTIKSATKPKPLPTGGFLSSLAKVSERQAVEPITLPTPIQPTTVAQSTPATLPQGPGAIEKTKTFAKDLFTGSDSTLGGIARNTILGIPKAAITPVTTTRRSVFDTTPTTVKELPVVTAANAIGRDILEFIPHALVAATAAPAEVYNVFAKKKVGEINYGVDTRRFGFETPKYQTAYKETSDAIMNGESPVEAGLRIASSKSLDVLFGAQLVGSAMRAASQALLKNGAEPAIDAWVQLGRKNTLDEALAYKKQVQSQVMDATKSLAPSQREKALADVTNQLNKALTTLKETGLPTTAQRARVAFGRATEVAGRETPVGKFITGKPFVSVQKSTTMSDLLTPNLKPRTSAEIQRPVVGFLAGTRPVGGKVQPKIGLSTQPVENVGKEPERALVDEAKKYKSSEEFVKAQGETVYHGTPNTSITELKPSQRGDLGGGVYFTRDKNTANNFADMAFRDSSLEAVGNGEYVNINTGEKIRPPKPGIIEAGIKGLNIKKLRPGEFSAEIQKLRQPDGVLPRDYENVAQQKWVKDGYDGIELSGTARGENDQIVVFPHAIEKIKTKSKLTDIWEKANGKPNPTTSFNRLTGGPKITKEEARNIIFKGIEKKDLRLLFTDELIDGNATGQFRIDPRVGNIIELYEKNGKVGLIDALHEQKHYLFSKLSPNVQNEALSVARADIGPMYKTILEKGYKEEGLYAGPGRENALLEEYIVDKWAKAQATAEHGYKKDAYARIFEALDKLLKRIVDTFREVKARFEATPNKQGGFAKNIFGGNEADRLIAEGKIRVVSRDGRDVYQYKKGNLWKTARDESSAVRQVTKTPQQIVYPEEIQKKQYTATLMGDYIANNPAKELEKYVSKSGDFKGGLKEVLGKGKSIFANKGDQIAEDLGFEDSEQARQAFEVYLKQKSDLAMLKHEIATDKRIFLEKSKVARLNSKLEEQSLNQQVSKEIPKPTRLSERPEDYPNSGLEQKGISEGEAMSLEKEAQSAHTRVDEAFSGETRSLPDIVSQEATSVKKKVNALDYIRTPDRVLKKIGFEQETQKLRNGYEEYLKELPKNIEKITKWSKSVSKDSNERIFKYLDNHSIDLTPNERAVAWEIRTWLKQWADRLNLPKDERLTHYITHIFDAELISKEFDEDLAKIIMDKVPGEVYDPFLQQRLGRKGYIQDTWLALDAYVKRATRKVHVDPALKAIRQKAGQTLEMSNIEASQFKYIQRYVNGINMRPTELDTLIDNTVKSVVGYKFGQRPVTALTAKLRRITFRGALDLNLGSALRNISQGVNTYAILGEKYTTLGYAKLFNKGSFEELQREGVFAAPFIEDRIVSSTKRNIQRADKVLFSFFESAERINRGSAYFGAKAKAIAEGKSELEAIEYAKSIVRKTQFNFDKIDTPVILQSDIMKTFFQFQTYTTKQIEFLTEMAKDKNFIGLIRYAVAGMVFVYTIGKLFGMEPKDMLPFYRFDTPASLKFITEAGKAALNVPDKYGHTRTLGQKTKDVLNSGTTLVPAGAQIKKSVRGTQAVMQGKSTDAAGKAQFPVGGSIPKDIQAILFGKYAGSGAKNKYNNEMTYAEQIYQKLEKSPTAKADFDKIIKEDPTLAKAVLEVKRKKDLGFTNEDDKILNMGVSNKARATAVVDKLNALKTREEKAALWQDYVNKKIITPDVAKQIKEMLNSGKPTSMLKGGINSLFGVKTAAAAETLPVPSSRTKMSTSSNFIGDIFKKTMPARKFSYVNPNPMIPPKPRDTQAIKFANGIGHAETSIIKSPYTYKHKNPNGTYDYGKYGINDSFFKSDGLMKRYAGKIVTPTEVLASPALQDKIVQTFFEYWSQKGETPQEIARMWTAGASSTAPRPQYIKNFNTVFTQSN